MSRFRLLRPLVLASVFLAGCSSSVQGIRTRAQSPSIDEAFRKLSLALTLDGYGIESVDPGRFFVRTEWRETKDTERSERDRTLTNQTITSKLVIKCDRRGKLYDVLVTPYLRYESTGDAVEVVADVSHPLWEKWRRTIHTLIQEEARDDGD